MKSILLASASIVAFAIAGAAQADVGFGAEGTLGFNDDDDDVEDDNDGIYWDFTLNVSAESMLDNGITIGASYSVDINEDNLGQNLESGAYLFWMTSDTSALYFGDITEGPDGADDFAAVSYWSGLADMDADAFSEADGEIVLRSDVTFGSISAAFSTVIADASGNIAADDPLFGGDGDFDQLSIGASGTFGNFTVGMAYQAESDAFAGGADGDVDGDGEDADDDPGIYDPVDENGDFSAAEVFGIFGSTTFGGADLSFAYADNQSADTNSTGVGISYTFGAFTLGAAFASNSDAPDTYEVTADYMSGPITVAVSYSDNEDGTDEEVTLDATYDVGGGFTLLAGFNDGDGTADIDSYVAAEWAIGDAATLLFSYATDDDDSEEDEIGDPEYQEGTTFELSFDF